MTPIFTPPFDVSDFAIVALKLIGGIPVGGGGIVILPGGPPIPVPPHGPRWYNLSPEMQDFLVGPVMRQMAPLVNNAEARKELQKLVSKLVSKEEEQLLKSLIKG